MHRVPRRGRRLGAAARPARRLAGDRSGRGARLLTEIDGIEALEDLWVIAATNRPDIRRRSSPDCGTRKHRTAPTCRWSRSTRTTSSRARTGRSRLIDLFEGRPQLIIYHFMFHPEWDDGCPSCTAGTNELSAGFLEHLHTRDTTYAMVSRAPLAKLERWKAKQGWDIPWYSSNGTDFNYDFGVTIDESRGFDDYNYRTQDEYEAHGRGQHATATSRSTCPAAAASCRSTAASSTRIRSTPGASNPPAARTTSSTSPRSAARRTGRSRRRTADGVRANAPTLVVIAPKLLVTA